MFLNIFDQCDTRDCECAAFDSDDALFVVNGRELRCILRDDANAPRDGLC